MSGPARSRIFTGPELTADHVLASACLPTHLPGGRDRRRALLGRRLYRQPAAVSAVLRDRDGRHPARADQSDRAAGDAAHRARDPEPAHRDHLQRQPPARIARHRFRHAADRRGQAVEGRVQARPHAPHVGRRRLSTPSRPPRASTPDWSFFKELKDLGRASAKAWLKKNYNAVGVRSTLDLRAAYS